MNRVLLGMSFLGAAAFAHADTLVFSNDFDTTVPIEVSAGTATLTGVQSYAGLGPAGNQFGGTFLRSATGNVGNDFGKPYGFGSCWVGAVHGHLRRYGGPV